LAVLEGLGWVTWQALRAERREQQARAGASFQESVRLALWRMESQATPIIAQEAARPYFEYHSFYPAERAYNRMWQEVEKNEFLVPSPLLESSGQCIRLHFQVEPDGTITSPQAPTGNMLDLAESQYVDSEFLVLASQMLGELTGMLKDVSWTIPPEPQRVHRERKPGIPEEAAAPQIQQLQADAAQGREADKDLQARQQAYEIANTPNEPSRRSRVEAAKSGSSKAEVPPPPAPAVPAPAASDEASRVAPKLKTFQAPGRAPMDVEQGNFQPLLFQRTVRVQGIPTVQGFWMDWPTLRSRLLGAVTDLLPDARLRPITSGTPDATPGLLRLASLPLELIPGPAPSVAGALVSPTHTTLVVTWLAVLGAIVAIAVVLRTSMELGDRRGRFVSAVTHELRTPLTTFCLYSEMLADGIVKDDSKRAEYLSTLKGESRRLARIVENVLNYARLGTPHRSARGQSSTIGALLESCEPLLQRCATQGGMRLQVENHVAASTRVAADQPTVERILLNLVENACKYAAEATDRTIRVEIEPGPGRAVVMAIRDFGPGIPRSERRRVFEAFHRSKRDANGPQSGLGLGLALSRGLARDMGGELAFTPLQGPGSRFALLLRVL
jgi:signal transduction histidine kinase